MSDHQPNFETVYNQYHQMVMQMCLGFVKGDKDVANDLTQETFINVWNAMTGFRQDSSFKTWIYRITVNTCLQHLRKEKNKTRVPFSYVMNEPEAQTAAESDNRLYAAIGQLSEIDRLVITMMLDELEYEEIAKVVGINETALRVRIHRIKQRLKKILEHEHSNG